MSTQLQRVWLILTEVRVVGDNPVGYTVGSKAFVQCFLPEMSIEPALLEMSRLIASEGMERLTSLGFRIGSYLNDEEHR